jgi:hypothetical protein
MSTNSKIRRELNIFGVVHSKSGKDQCVGVVENPILLSCRNSKIDSDPGRAARG